MNMFQKIKEKVRLHKKASIFLLVVVLLVSFYSYKKTHNTALETRYVLAAVTKGTLISSVSGTGQVSVSDQIDIKPKASGDVIYVPVQNGQYVKAGTLLVELDPTDAQKAVKNAQIDLQNSQISLSKLQLSQASSIPQIQDSITTTQNNLDQEYQSAFNEISSDFLDFPNLMDGIHGILYDSTVGTSGQTNTGAYKNLMDQDGLMGLTQIINQAENDYLAASNKYTANLITYQQTSRNSTPDQISALLDETLETAKVMSQAVKDEQNILNTVTNSLTTYQSNRSVPSQITKYQSDVASYINTLNSHINSLTSIKNSIISGQQSLANYQRQLSDTQQNNPLDLTSQQNAVYQKQIALQNAQDTLADCYVRAPFDGVIATVNVKKGDSASSGTAIATIISKQEIAEISLNEIDAANVKVGQKATLTFDAISNLTITGEVSEVDTIGTVSQGVVTYDVKINFDTQDTRVKPGMTVTAAIITDTKQDVLMVPNSAIKSQGQTSFVEIPNSSENTSQLLANGSNNAGILLNPAPTQQAVETGVSNDTDTEVTSGIKEGDIIVVRTVSSTVTSTTTSPSNRSLFQSFGGGGNRATGR